MNACPAKCETCGFSTRHTRQLDGEVLLYSTCCSLWMCAACRVDRCCPPDAVLANPVAPTRFADGVPANDGIYSHISDNTYHSDRDSLSSSGARTLLNDCPAVFEENRNEPPDPKPQYDFGHAAHKMVLGEGSQLVRVDAPDWRTKDAQIARKTAWANGKAPLLKKDIDKAQRMAGVVHTNRIAAKLLSEGTPEVSGYWHDDETGVRLRFRPDWLPELPGRTLCVDYKTAVSANPTKFIKSALDYGYHQQAAWYLDGLREVGISDDAAFLFIVQAKTAPYLVSLVQLLPEHVELGRRQNRAAIDLYAKCLSDNSWPGYGDGIHTVGLPNWAVSQIEASLTDVA